MKICLCGSTKFKDEFHEANIRLSKAGHVVYSVAAFMHAGDKLTVHEKQNLDKVHLLKIEYSDAIYLVHPDYIGESTKNEIRYACNMGKQILIPQIRQVYIPYENGVYFDSFSNPHMYIHTCFGKSCKDWAKARPCARCL